MDNRDPRIESLVIRYLIAHTQCSGCGQHYEPQDVHVHSHRGQVWLASLTCRQCGLKAMVMAALQLQGTSAESQAVEQDADEIATIQELGPIGSDEILDVHRFLDDFRGDMRGLFQKRAGQ
jgi:hypothetical protein